MHRESSRASVLNHSGGHAVLHSSATAKCCLTMPSLLSRATRLGTERVRTVFTNPTYLESCSSLPFGDALTCQGNGDFSTLHFTGKEHDYESGLDYFGARFDASSFGRFMSPDPLLNSAHPGEPQSWNRYSYVANNPMRNVDPLGLFTWKTNCDEAKDVACHQHRQEIRDAIAKLKTALNSDKISDKEKKQIRNVLDAYGDEGRPNGVSIGFGHLSGAPAYTKQEGNAITVWFDSSSLDYQTQHPARGTDAAVENAAMVAHEGEHVFIDQIYGPTMSSLGEVGLTFHEYESFDTQSLVNKALNKKSGWGLWNPSWANVDKELLRWKNVVRNTQEDVKRELKEQQ